MPKSKHRRHGKVRKREHETHAPVKNAPPSPPWIPVAGVALLIAGVAVILLGYLPVVQDITRTWRPLGSNWGLVIGFVLLTGGFGFLTRWR